MFQKPTFGASTPGFGMQQSFGASPSTSTSPFGGFKPATASSAFGGPPAFGANTSAQPSAGTGLFGASNTSGGGLFGGGAAAAPAPAFGTPTTGFSFGASTSAGTGGLFASNTSSGIFGNTQPNNAFAAKPAGFGFSAPTATPPQNSSLFGASATPSTGLFGQQSSTLGGGLFSNNTAGGFGQQQASGTGHVKYNPVVGSDVVVKGGTSQNISVKHHCITCMKEYETKSLEELRLEDYTAGRKGNSGGMFPFQQQQQAKPLFGASTSFGAAATTSAPSVFGGGLNSSGAFGQSNSFAFGGNAQPNTSTAGLFGATKPAFGATPGTGSSIFGAPATTQAAGFGATAAPSFGFGSNLQNQTTGGGIFGAKPATSVFGAPAASSGFGSFGGANVFGAKPTQTQAPTFGAPQPGIGTQALGFGANTSTSNSFFGATPFGKPAQPQNSFGFGTAQPGLGLGANSFLAKPATAPFGQLGNSMFQQPNAGATFRTGFEGGLGGGMFGTNSGIGGSALGLGANANNSALANNLSGSSAAGNVHEQILTLAARPYGDSPLFKDLLPDSSTTAEDVLRPTNPAAMKAVLDRSASSYRVTSPTGIRLKLQPKTAPAHHKKSLFDGLEEYDSSLDDKLSLKPSRKRLVLRPNQRPGDNESMDNNHSGMGNRSQEDQQHNETNGDSQQGESETAAPLPPRQTETAVPLPSRQTETDAERAKRNISFDNNNDVSSDRQGSWLSASKMPWSEQKEKPIDNEPTPRLYPSLDKEQPSEGSERRASWLTTKTLRKPLVTPPQNAENSIRELGLRSVSAASFENKENVSVSEESVPAPRDAPPHPAGVKLTRPGYYTIPTLDEMTAYLSSDGTCVVPNLTIGRTNYGNVHYDSEVNVAGLDLDALVHFLNKEVIVYPEDADKPPVGEGLNKRAIVTLDRIWPRDKTENRPITDQERLWEYERKLRRVCEKHETKFIEYRAQSGSWVFRVEHFSKYGLTDSDEEDEMTPEVMKRQLVNQTLQKSAAPAMKPPVTSSGLGGIGVTSPGLGGLGVASPGLGGLGVSSPGLGGLGMASPSLGGLGMASPGLGGLGVTSSGLGLGVTSPSVAVTSAGFNGAGGSNSIFAMQQASLNLLNGSRAFEMDTTEDNTESQSLYQDNKAYGVKSPTSELARLENRQSHHVQLMKASLYADTEMEDDISVSTGDQLVPMSAPLLSVSEAPPSQKTLREEDENIPAATILPDTAEVQMPPLIVKPHTIVLKYHRKVPPFKHTIAGGLDASYMSDLSVARARHSRVGFGARGNIVFPTSYDSIVDLPKTAYLSDLDKYTRGRESHDWSEPVVARLALQHTDYNYNIQEILGRQLETLFQHSEFVEPSSENIAPRLRLLESPRERHATLQRLLRDAEETREKKPKFGVSGAYCYEVWKLCDALWGADLENDGIPGTDNLSIVNRYRKFLEWMTAAVEKITDAELAQTKKGEAEDENDGHSARVWTLLLGGRTLQACKLAKEKGDLNLAALIAQAAGDPAFRSLIIRQLTQWRECGADKLISGHKRAILQLIAGSPPREDLALAHWMHALHATARFLCPQVPSLEQIVRKYEGFFSPEPVAPEDLDLSTLDSDEMGMQLPLPPYAAEYDVVVCQSGQQRRVLDLRYQLIRARALNTRPAPRPAHYTNDPLDHSLCFILGIWFGTPSARDAAAVADQLEAAGAWHLAVHALSFHPEDRARSHLIRNMLSRHAPAAADTPDLKARLELIKKLRVPEKWLLTAQAHRAKYEHLPLIEAEHLASSEQWNAAHAVLIEKLLPGAVLSDTLPRLGALLARLAGAAAEHRLGGWGAGGRAAHEYLRVCGEIRGLVSSPEAGRDRTGMQARLEALRPAVAAACRALCGLKATSPLSAAARAEMGARLVALALAAAEPAPQLAALLRALALPPDCTANAQYKITMDLAEQASELCIESASSSPISSHHRATAAS